MIICATNTFGRMSLFIWIVTLHDLNLSFSVKSIDMLTIHNKTEQMNILYAILFTLSIRYKITVPSAIAKYIKNCEHRDGQGEL